MRPLGGGNSTAHFRQGRINELKTSANIWKFFVKEPSFRFQFFAANYDVGLEPCRCLIPSSIGGRSNLDRDFDVLAASVDRLGVLLDTTELKSFDHSLFVAWDTFYKASDDDNITTEENIHDPVVRHREEISINATLSASFLRHVAIEIKNETIEATRLKAEEVLNRAQSLRKCSSSLWECEFDDEVYHLLVPWEQRFQIRNHCAVLGLTLGVYVKSSS